MIHYQRSQGSSLANHWQADSSEQAGLPPPPPPPAEALVSSTSSPSEPPSLIKTARIAALVGSVIATLLALASLVCLLAASERAPLFAVFQCLYLVVQSSLGLYASHFRSQQALALFVLMCIFNFVLLTTVLLVDSSNQIILGRLERAGRKGGRHWPESCERLFRSPQAAECLVALAREEAACNQTARAGHPRSRTPATCCPGRSHLLALAGAPTSPSQTPNPFPPGKQADKPASRDEVFARIVFWLLASYNLLAAFLSSCLVAFDADKPRKWPNSQSEPNKPAVALVQAHHPDSRAQQEQQFDLARAQELAHYQLASPSSEILVALPQSAQTRAHYQLRAAPSPSSPPAGQPAEPSLAKSARSSLKAAKTPAGRRK